MLLESFDWAQKYVFYKAEQNLSCHSLLCRVNRGFLYLDSKSLIIIFSGKDTLEQNKTKRKRTFENVLCAFYSSNIIINRFSNSEVKFEIYNPCVFSFHITIIDRSMKKKDEIN
jgi:hypothetical protein